MKIKLHQILLFIVLYFFYSCSGEFIPSKENYILLTGPIDRCEDGRVDDLNTGNIIVNFSWEANGSFERGNLIITEKLSGVQVIDKEIETATTTTEISLKRGLEYQWYIESISAENSAIIKSKSKEFFSEFVDDEETPYPVVITNKIETADSFVLEWENHPDESKNDLSYIVYFSSRIAIDEIIAYKDLDFSQAGNSYKSGEQLQREQLKNGLKAGDYFFKIDAIAQSGANQLISSTYARVQLLSDY